MINILTRPPKIFFKGSVLYFTKSFLSYILNKRRGPSSVFESLKRGLDEIGVEYVVNAPFEKDQIVGVLSNVEALRYAIKAKRHGEIRKLIAGPNLVVLPREHNAILASKEIDAVLTVSEWTHGLYSSQLPEANDRIYIWPAGVKVSDTNPRIYTPHSPLSCLVFQKHAPQELYQSVIQTLTEKHIDIKTLTYGSYSQEEYFNLLTQVDFMVYLQETESQGLAVQEAWARNIPTLVWNKGTHTFANGYIAKGNISAPYLTDEAGMFFGNDDFNLKLEEFIPKLPSFCPYEYCKRELSDRTSASIYVKIAKTS